MKSLRKTLVSASPTRAAHAFSAARPKAFIFGYISKDCIFVLFFEGLKWKVVPRSFVGKEKVEKNPRDVHSLETNLRRRGEREKSRHLALARRAEPSRDLRVCADFWVALKALDIGLWGVSDIYIQRRVSHSAPESGYVPFRISVGKRLGGLFFKGGDSRKALTAFSRGCVLDLTKASEKRSNF